MSVPVQASGLARGLVWALVLVRASASASASAQEPASAREPAWASVPVQESAPAREPVAMVAAQALERVLARESEPESAPPQRYCRPRRKP